MHLGQQVPSSVNQRLSGTFYDVPWEGRQPLWGTKVGEKSNTEEEEKNCSTKKNHFFRPEVLLIVGHRLRGKKIGQNKENTSSARKYLWNTDKERKQIR